MGEVKFKGSKASLKGTFPKVGDVAPEFTLVGQDLVEKKLSDFEGRKLINIFPSIDTPVCAVSVREFYKKCQGITVLNISMDLPFAAKRFCESEGMDHVVTLSAFRSTFPEDYGVRIEASPLKGLCARAVLILDEKNKVIYTELVPEITQDPDYESSLAAIERA